VIRWPEHPHPSHPTGFIPCPADPVLRDEAILHHRFETLHLFTDTNGRTGRALALWELYRRGFDSHHIFAVDEFYWEDRPRYYAALDAVRREGDELTSWLEYCAEGLQQALERVWKRMGQLSLSAAGEKVILRPRQEQLLKLLGKSGGMTPAELWAALKVSKQGAMDMLRPLLKAGLVKRVGTLKSGRDVLRSEFRYSTPANPQRMTVGNDRRQSQAR
jgi:Fic family protein